MIHVECSRRPQTPYISSIRRWAFIIQTMTVCNNIQIELDSRKFPITSYFLLLLKKRIRLDSRTTTSVWPSKTMPNTWHHWRTTSRPRTIRPAGRTDLWLSRRDCQWTSKTSWTTWRNYGRQKKTDSTSAVRPNVPSAAGEFWNGASSLRRPAIRVSRQSGSGPTER